MFSYILKITDFTDRKQNLYRNYRAWHIFKDLLHIFVVTARFAKKCSQIIKGNSIVIDLKLYKNCHLPIVSSIHIFKYLHICLFVCLEPRECS